MEKVYYKGKILKVSELQKKSLFIGDLKNYGYCVSSDTFLDFINTLKLDIYDKLIEEFDSVINNESINLENPIFSSVKKEINNSLINLHENKQDTVEVIFEIITTRNGDLYGKELYTGLLFPIANMNKIEYRIEVEVQNDIIKNKEENQIYFTASKLNTFYDCHHYNIYNSKTALFSVVYYEERPYLNEKFWSSTRNMDYYFTSCRSYDLYPLINSFENLDLC